MMRKVLREYELALHSDEEIKAKLETFSEKMKLQSDQELRIQLVIRKRHKSNIKRIFVTVESALSSDQWGKILLRNNLTIQERQLLQNYQEAQSYGELWISRNDAMRNVGNNKSHYQLMLGLNAKLTKTQFRVRKKKNQNLYGFFEICQK